MYRLLCADIRKMCMSKIFWFAFGCIVIVCPIMFQLLNVIIGCVRDWETVYADITLTVYPSIAPMFIAAFVGIYVGIQFGEGTLKNKLMIGGKRSDIFLSMVIVTVLATVMFQVTNTILNVILGNVLLDGFVMSNMDIIKNAFVYMLSSIVSAVFFTTVTFTLGNGKISSMICIIIAFVFKIITSEIVTMLYPISGKCTLQGIKYSFCSFFDKYVFFSYFNGGIRYEMSTYIKGFSCTVIGVMLLGIIVFQRKDMN